MKNTVIAIQEDRTHRINCYALEIAKDDINYTVERFATFEGAERGNRLLYGGEAKIIKISEDLWAYRILNAQTIKTMCIKIRENCQK